MELEQQHAAYLVPFLPQNRMTDDPLQLPPEVGAFPLPTLGAPALYYRDCIPVEKCGSIFLQQSFLPPPRPTLKIKALF